MALDMWNEVTLEVAEKTDVVVSGEGEESLARDETNLVGEGGAAGLRGGGKATSGAAGLVPQ